MEYGEERGCCDLVRSVVASCHSVVQVVVCWNCRSVIESDFNSLWDLVSEDLGFV